MVCRHCRADNSDGRENCAVCGRPLLDIGRIMVADRHSGRAVKYCGIGTLVGVGGGAALGAILGALIGGAGAALAIAWAGAWIGGLCGAIVGFLAGLILGPPRQHL